MNPPVTSSLSANRYQYQCVTNVIVRCGYVESGTWFTAFRRNFLRPSSVQKSKTRLIWRHDDYIITKTPRPTPSFTVSHKLSLDGVVVPTSVCPLFGTQCNPAESSNEFSYPAAREVLLLGTHAACCLLHVASNWNGGPITNT
jgi:hypothetical protein